MNLILVPGLWLGAWSWDRVTPALRAAGHHVNPITRPGLDSVETDRTGIGMADTVAALVDVIDQTDGDVVLVGHSGGGNVVYGATDQRPERVRRVIFVDSGPMPDGAAVNPSIPGDGVEIPLPPWDFFRAGGDDRDLRDLTDEMLADIRARAIPEPWGVANDPLSISNPARFDVPMTMISSTFSREEIDEAIKNQVPYFAEVLRIRNLEIDELPTGHWPQFSKPDELAQHILAAL
ncbi:MAG: alpha/beta fold hydrolase [Micromonosporaceae bacterium]|nr:alpha/beta fold hydrolase [Micromonosporaceae bacterium]